MRLAARIIDAAEAVERTLVAPYTVLIHGDYNTNNILYDPAEDRIHYIDLHRSADADLVQDVSVYMISHFRLPVFDAPRRKMLLTAITSSVKRPQPMIFLTRFFMVRGPL